MLAHRSEDYERTKWRSLDSKRIVVALSLLGEKQWCFLKTSNLQLMTVAN